jgi:hypothetical protein
MGSWERRSRSIQPTCTCAHSCSLFNVKPLRAHSESRIRRESDTRRPPHTRNGPTRLDYTCNRPTPATHEYSSALCCSSKPVLAHTESQKKTFRSVPGENPTRDGPYKHETSHAHPAYTFTRSTTPMITRAHFVGNPSGYTQNPKKHI